MVSLRHATLFNWEAVKENLGQAHFNMFTTAGDDKSDPGPDPEEKKTKGTKKKRLYMRWDPFLDSTDENATSDLLAELSALDLELAAVVLSGGMWFFKEPLVRNFKLFERHLRETLGRLLRARRRMKVWQSAKCNVQTRNVSNFD